MSCHNSRERMSDGARVLLRCRVITKKVFDERGITIPSMAIDYSPKIAFVFPPQDSSEEEEDMECAGDPPHDVAIYPFPGGYLVAAAEMGSCETCRQYFVRGVNKKGYTETMHKYIDDLQWCRTKLQVKEYILSAFNRTGYTKTGEELMSNKTFKDFFDK